MVYYVLIDGKQMGPYASVEALPAITPDTMVWKEGMPAWVSAAELPELSSLFAPPPLPGGMEAAAPSMPQAPSIPPAPEASATTPFQPYFVNDLSGISQSAFRPESFLITSYLNGFFLAQGGKLWIYDDVMVFKPHALNFGDTRHLVIPIEGIFAYQKDVMTWLNIYYTSGMEFKMACYSKNKIINAVEQRRQYLYRQRGLQAPEVRYL